MTIEITFSQIKTIKSFCENELFSAPCYREVLEEILDGSNDFEIDNVRFIKESEIVSILAEELGSDESILGYFNADFLSRHVNAPEELIKCAQQGEQFEMLGEWVGKTADMEALAEDYASCDGYGHHFNSYDGSEEELIIGDLTYLVFDNR